MAAPRRGASRRTATPFTSRVTRIAHKLGEEGFGVARYACFLTRSLAAIALAFVLSAGAAAKGTRYVFVSNEKTNNIAVLDPNQDYKIINWIPTSHRLET
jgi:hypothetical protein